MKRRQAFDTSKMARSPLVSQINTSALAETNSGHVIRPVGGRKVPTRRHQISWWTDRESPDS